MRLIRLIKKEIKQQFRDKQGLFMMMLFPLILTVVLGFSLSGLFGTSNTPTQVSALYSVEKGSLLGQEFVSQFVPNSKDMNLILTEEPDAEKAKSLVTEGNASCFIYISGDKITIYAREGNTFGASLTSALINGFTGAFDAYSIVEKINPAAFPELGKAEGKHTIFTNDVSLNRKSSPSAMNYYAITMLTLIIMYASLSGAGAISDERRHKTLNRILASPAKNTEILISKVLGSVLAIILQVAFVFLCDKVLLNTYWGEDLISIFIILLAQILMVISIGVSVGFLFKKSDAGVALIQTFIPVLVFLGGGYVNFEMVGITGFMEKLSQISPVRWINKTILQIVYARDYSGFATTVIMCLVIAAVFLGLSAVLSRRELKA